MTDVASSLFAWQSFYVIVGSSGGALIGIQFVVITLVAALRHAPTDDEVGAYASPTVVHFALALIVSAVMSAPWASLVPPSLVLAALGSGGLVYVAAVIRRARRQTGYAPVWQDWVWYTSLPSCAYAAIALAAPVLPTRTQLALSVIGTAALALLVIGVHNAWDSVKHIVLVVRRPDDTKRAE
ncbi:MAG TPA: hypothetical protein VMT70_22495 [Vicinamibacteria bacterium]|nr:hypothetical protein [Vicinamibacteria bacterium]